MKHVLGAMPLAPQPALEGISARCLWLYALPYILRFCRPSSRGALKSPTIAHGSDRPPLHNMQSESLPQLNANSWPLACAAAPWARCSLASFHTIYTHSPLHIALDDAAAQGERERERERPLSASASNNGRPMSLDAPATDGHRNSSGVEDVAKCGGTRRCGERASTTV